MLLITVGRGVFATDVVVSASTVSNAQFPAAGADRSVTVTATSGSAVVTSSAAFPPNLVGVPGWKILINSSVYTVSSVASTSSLTLTTNFSGGTSTYTATIYKLIFLQLYADRAYTPLSATYVVQPGNPSQPNGFFARYGCSIISNSLYIPAVTIPSMIDSANAQDRTARISAVFFTTGGARLVPYQNFTFFQVPATPTTTTWTALATYNAPASTYQLDSLTYSRDQIASLLSSIAAISGLTANRLPYAASATSLADSANATLNSSGDLVAATISSPSITDSGLTAGRFIYTGTGGLLSASSKGLLDANGNGTLRSLSLIPGTPGAATVNWKDDIGAIYWQHLLVDSGKQWTLFDYGTQGINILSVIADSQGAKLKLSNSAELGWVLSGGSEQAPFIGFGNDGTNIEVNNGTLVANGGSLAPVKLSTLNATGLIVGGGTTITKILTGSASLDFGATAAGTCDTLTITVTGAVDGDEVFLGIPNALAAADTYQTFYGWVSGSGVVSVKRCNPINSVTALSNPSAATVRATVFHH